MIANNILELIGNTPIVRINKLNLNPNLIMYAKLEGQNPGGSVKDRIALSMIEAAEKSKELTKEKIILEPTSGNTGIGIALIGAVKGYKSVLVMSSAVSVERKGMIKAFGAEIIETNPNDGTDGAIRKAHQMNKENPGKYWMPNQFDNPNNPQAHYTRTAEEIIRAVPEITVFVCGLGTTGTLMGVSSRLKEHNKNIQIIGVEPPIGHKIQGLKNMSEAIVPKIYSRNKIDQIVTLTNEQAYDNARKLAKYEGIFAGMSSGAAMFGAIQVAGKIEKGVMVILFPDRGEKYLSTPLYS